MPLPISAIIVAAVAVILLIIPKFLKQKTYKQLSELLSNGKYDEFEELLDGFICTFSFKPFNREYMRLTSYMMQNDTDKINMQLDNILTKFKVKGAQRRAVAERGFFFYMEQKEYRKAGEMLAICKDTDNKTSELHIMELMYDILALKKSTYIVEIDSRLKELKKDPNAETDLAKKTRIGVFEYLIGLQYVYLKNQSTSQKYLKSALKHCANTPYEQEIKALVA